MTTVTWASGWPTLNDGKPILLSESFGSTPDQKYPPSAFRDTFSDSKLDPHWYQLRIPYTKNYELGNTRRWKQSHTIGNSHQSGIRLFPNVFSLSDRDTPAAIFRKQKSLNMTFSATLLPANGSLGYRQSVGISVYLSEFQHQDIGIRGCVDETGMCVYSTLMMNSTSIVGHAPFQWFSLLHC